MVATSQEAPLARTWPLHPSNAKAKLVAAYESVSAPVLAPPTLVKVNVIPGRDDPTTCENAMLAGLATSSGPAEYPVPVSVRSGVLDPPGVAVAASVAVSGPTTDGVKTTPTEHEAPPASPAIGHVAEPIVEVGLVRPADGVVEEGRSPARRCSSP